MVQWGLPHFAEVRWVGVRLLATGLLAIGAVRNPYMFLLDPSAKIVVASASLIGILLIIFSFF